MFRLLFALFILTFLSLKAQKRHFNFQMEDVSCFENLNIRLAKQKQHTIPLHKMSVSANLNYYYSIQLDIDRDSSLLHHLKHSACVQNLEMVPKTTLATIFIPNDTLYPAQWNLDFIDAPEAWGIRNPTDTILIGIVDTGTDFDHPDLQNFYRNEADPENGLDDDGNGLVDDYRGWDFGMVDNNAQIADGIGLDHGVQMTSLAAAPSNNLHGIASPAPMVKYLPIKITNDQGGIGDPYEGVAYAIEMGCKVINCSWTQSAITNYGKSVIALAKEKGILIVGAAGNFDNNNPQYPCADPTVLCVAAIDDSGEKTTVSSYGPWIDIASPGLNMWAARPGSNYGLAGGTSGACAFTSGTAAWLFSIFPEEDGTAIKNRIMEGAKEHSLLFEPYLTNLGTGTLNMFQAQENEEKSFSGLEVWPNPSNGNFSVTFRLVEMEDYSLFIFDVLGREIVRKTMDNLQLGENQVDLNLVLKSGAYYLVLKAENTFFLQEIFIGN